MAAMMQYRSQQMLRMSDSPGSSQKHVLSWL
jgi:hypothetical protein